MRFGCRVVVLLFCLSLPAFAQDLSIYSHMGKLTPHVAGSNPEQSLLVYKQRGVVFQTFRGTIMTALVFQPGLTPPAARSIGANELVPGVGACGIMLNMPREQIRAVPFSRGGEDVNSGLYEVDQHTHVFMRFYAGRVSQLEVIGNFATPEAIATGSTVAQVETVYGLPDQQLDFEMRKGFLKSVMGFLAMPILGLVAGFVLRKTRPSLVLAMAFGAAGLLIADLLAALVWSHFSGFDKDWHSIAYTLAEAVLVGAGSVLTLELLSRRLGGCLGSLATLLAMLFVSLIAILVVGAVRPAGPLTSPWGMLLLLTGPYVVALFLAAGTKRPV